MSLLILGDCHGAWPRLIAAVDAGAALGARAAIQVGDFGFFPRTTAALLDQLAATPFPIPLHAIDGNHEDHAWLWSQAAAFPRWAAECNLIVHRRGDTALIDGLRVGFLGGALHVDRDQHGSAAEGTSNWVTDDEARRAAAAFSAAEVDLVVTHSCPHSLGIGMSGSPLLYMAAQRYITAQGFNGGLFDDCGEPALRLLWAGLPKRPRAWVFGHFHRHKEVLIDGTVFRCVGSCDGSDGKTPTIGHLLDPATWTWRELPLAE